MHCAYFCQSLKMSMTPEKIKDTSLNKTLTPVRSAENQSPGGQLIDSNLAACKARLVTLVENLQNNSAKWKRAQMRGTSLCQLIEANKTRNLQSQNTESTRYPKELKTSCDKLAIITNVCIDITNNTREILHQLRALGRLRGSTADTILFRTWPLRQFVSFVHELLQRYEQEVAIKQHVMENIAHCTGTSELIALTTSWEHPVHIDGYVYLRFLLLAEEVK